MKEHESMAAIPSLDVLQSDQLAQTLELASWQHEVPQAVDTENGSLASQVLDELGKPTQEPALGESQGWAGSLTICMHSGLSFRLLDHIAHGLYRLKCHPLFAPENAKQLERVLNAKAPFEASAEVKAGALLAISIRHGLLIPSEDPLKMREANRLTRHLGSSTINKFYHTILRDSHSEHRPRYRIDGLFTGAVRPTISDIKRAFALISGLEYQASPKPNDTGWQPFKSGQAAPYGLRAQHTALTKIPKSKSFSYDVLTERVPPLLNRIVKAHHRELGLPGSGVGMAKVKQLAFISSAATEHAIELRSFVAKVALIAANRQAWSAFETESVKSYLGELDSLILHGPVNVDF